LKANYLAEHFGYDITIILTEGKDKPLFYPLSDKVKVVNLDINFEVLWTCSFIKKVFVYLKKQRQYKKLLTEELMRIHPDVTISLLRREINFINEIKDGSKKIGELHVNRANYRSFDENESNCIKQLFSKWWMNNLVKHLKKLDKFVVLTNEDKQAWKELTNLEMIPDPLSFKPQVSSSLIEKRVIAVGRYVYQKGFDLLLKAWAQIEKECPDWELAIYGEGDRTLYQRLIEELGIDSTRCHLCERSYDIEKEYCRSSIFVFSSRFEGFGMVLVEAMACGLPVVSYDCPCGPKDIVKDGEDGLLVENGNTSALAQGLIALIKDDGKRKAMSEAALRNVQRFQIEHIAQQWKFLFELINKKDQ